MNPSGVMIKPEPLPAPSRPLRPLFFSTSIFTTDGLTSSAAVTTALEYASSNGASETGALSEVDWPLNTPLSSEIGVTLKSFSTIFINKRPRLNSGLLTSKRERREVKLGGYEVDKGAKQHETAS